MICAQAKIIFPDGRTLVAQVDGGTGHSGRRSPDVQFGLGNINPATPLDVEVKWRDNAGQAQQTVLKLAPGWHTVVLGHPATGPIVFVK